MPDNVTVISQTKKWVSTIVIGHGLCPFAKREYDNDRIHYGVVGPTDRTSQLEHLIEYCTALDKNPDRETSLLIFPQGLSDYNTYLDMLDLANALLKQQGYTGIYQLASFHPQYRFADTDDHDPSNYTNRSPYPMLHILREASLEAALNSYQNPEKIPERNIQVTRDLGLEVMRDLLTACYD